MASKQVFRDCALFDFLSEIDLEKLAAISVPHEWEAGATIFAEGSPAKDLYVVEQGKVALQMHLPSTQAQLSKRITVDAATRGEVFGWSAVMEPYKSRKHHTYTLTAVCLERTKGQAIDGFKLRNMLKADHRTGYEVLSQLITVVASRLDETRHLLISERLALLPMVCSSERRGQT